MAPLAEMKDVVEKQKRWLVALDKREFHPYPENMI